jgi:hypothetical protein
VGVRLKGPTFTLPYSRIAYRLPDARGRMAPDDETHELEKEERPNSNGDPGPNGHGSPSDAAAPQSRARPWPRLPPRLVRWLNWLHAD